MRKLLLFSCFLSVLIEFVVAAQAPTAPGAPQPKTGAPTTQAPPAKTAPPPTTATTPRRATSPTTGRAGIAVTATTPQGATVAGVHVDMMGPTLRGGDTDGSGQVNFTGLQAGTYRLRFTGEKVTTFEKEVVVRAGQVSIVDVTLNPAPEPRVVTVKEPAPPTPASSGSQLGPKGEPLTVAIEEFLEKEFVGRQPRRESLLSCSGNERTTMIQLNDPLPERLYESADAVYYVLGGEGNIKMNGRESRLVTNGFASVPRGVSHSFSRRGNRSLILLAVLSGEPCEQAR